MSEWVEMNLRERASRLRDATGAERDTKDGQSDTCILLNNGATKQKLSQLLYDVVLSESEEVLDRLVGRSDDVPRRRC